jgi:hypothetical protein
MRTLAIYDSDHEEFQLQPHAYAFNHDSGPEIPEIPDHPDIANCPVPFRLEELLPDHE